MEVEIDCEEFTPLLLLDNDDDFVAFFEKYKSLSESQHMVIYININIITNTYNKYNNGNILFKPKNIVENSNLKGGQGFFNVGGDGPSPTDRRNKQEINALSSKNDSIRLKQVETIIDEKVLRLYSITTYVIIDEHILISIGRNMVHMSILILTILICINISIDEILSKAMLTLFSICFIYQFSYYTLLLFNTFITFKNDEEKRGKILWSTFISLSTIFLFILSTYFGAFFIYDFLNAANGTHSTFTLILTSIIVVFLTFLVSTKSVLNDAEKWSSVIRNEIDIDGNYNETEQERFIVIKDKQN